MSKYFPVLSFLLLTILLHAVNACPSCPEGEEHSTCGTSCERSCQNINDEFDCADVCVKGCFCEDGLVREDDHKGAKCIPPSECADEYPSCNEGEEYSTCGTACELTCDNKNDGNICEDVCVEGCFCEDGLVRESDNKGARCIPLDDCNNGHQSCPEGEKYSTCGTACELTCDNKNDENSCEDVCVEGCFCEDGLVRESDNKGARCIPLDDCNNGHQSCPEGEKYSTCGTACELTCDNKNDGNICEDVCVEGCFCEDGLVRESDNKGARCIPLDDCNNGHQSCPEGEKYSTCGTACELTCDNKNDENICEDVCVEGCFCEDGLVRESDNKGARCIPLDDCNNGHQSCPEGEKYSTCGTACELTCDNKNNENSCEDVCVEGCFCEDGLVRESDNKGARCISSSECPAVLLNLW